MAVFYLQNVYSYVDDYDFTTDTNEARLQVDVDELDATTFRSGGAKAVIGGLRGTAYDMAGLWQASASGSPDTEGFPDLGLGNKVYTVGAAETEATASYLFRAGKFKLQQFGKIGEITPFSISSMGTDSQGLVQGQLGKAKGNVSATGALGSGCNLGAVSATQFLYASFHVFTAATTITVVVESDDNSGFTTPVTQMTIGPLTTTGGVWATRVAGAITDTWYRFRVTTITGTFNVAGAIGIK